MKARRLEDVFEECLTAYLEKGRSVEESLSLYPALASALEPLLRTAVSLNTTLEASGPPWHALERGRNRFLASARAYSTGKALMRDAKPRHAAPWGRIQWSLVGGAAAAMAAVVVVGAIMVSGGSGSTDNGGDDGRSVSQPSPTARPVPQSVREIQITISEATNKAAAGEEITIDELARLQIEYEIVQQQLNDPTISLVQKAAIFEQILEDRQAIEALPVEQQQTPGVIGLLSLVDLLLLDLTATPAPTPVETPAATPVETAPPTDAPVETPAPTEPPVETPVPATDTPAPTPDVTPDVTPEPTPVFQLFGN